MRRLQAGDVARIGLMAALTAVGAFLRVPLPYVPFTLQIAFVCLGGLWLGPWRGAVCQVVYLSAGLIGFPIFAKGGGPHYILEPTFGYLAGFVPGAFVTGYVARGSTSLPRLVAAVFAGMLLVYCAGIAHLYLILSHAAGADITLWAAARVGLAPLPKDLVLGLLAACLGRRLIRMGV
ncbi:biotin transporter BioY [Candidatus Latescibacterota bacterium]